MLSWRAGAWEDGCVNRRPSTVKKDTYAGVVMIVALTAGPTEVAVTAKFPSGLLPVVSNGPFENSQIAIPEA